jgi:hypothetical protein
MVESSGEPLGIKCLACRHRALVPVRVLRRCDHDMTPIKSLLLVCRGAAGRGAMQPPCHWSCPL